MAAVVTTSPIFAVEDGEVTETEYSTSLTEATGVVRIIVAIFGGLIGVLGIVVAVKGVAGKSDVSLALSEQKKIAFKNVSQGAVMTIIGAAILLGATYLLPEKRSERHIRGHGIAIEERDGGRVHTLAE